MASPSAPTHTPCITVALRYATLLTCLCAGSSTAAAQGLHVQVERTAWFMGATLSVSATTRSATAGFRAIEQAFDSVRAYERLLSTWRPDTELSGLNAAPLGRWVRLSPPLWTVLTVAASWQAASGGAFDPAVGALIDAWDLRGAGRQPSPDALRRARGASGLAHFELADDRYAARRVTEGAWIDAGAFGKGAALRAAVEALHGGGVGAAVLNFGGQVVVRTPRGKTGTPVSVAHPRQRHRPVATLILANGSIATTGQSERGVTNEGVAFGHVLDPRTGTPVPPWGSVTVVHPDPLVADMLATALFVLGPDSGFAWAERHDVAALFLRSAPPGAEGDRLQAAVCTRAVRPYIKERSTCL